jgi:bacillithiol synthase
MESACVRHTDLPGTSRLFADYVYRFDRVERYYSFAPFSVEAYREAAEKVEYPESRRAAITNILGRQNGASPAVELLGRPGTVAVVTGQQVGLFSGPSYTIYKALTAARIAAELRQQGIPAVPLFWLATQDHDLEEVNHCWVYDPSHQPVKLSARASAKPGQPVGGVVLDELPLEELEAALGRFAFGPEVIQQVREAYVPGSTYGAAFRKLMQSLLKRFDIPVLDPLDEEVQELAAPLLRQAVGATPELVSRLAERNAELEAAGYHAQVLVEKQTSLFFLIEAGQRVTLRRREGNYVANGRTYTAADLEQRSNQLSPNALLRPVVQDYLLPTAAYVGGPAEVAYLAQSQVLYEGLLGRMPVIIPRQGFTVLDGRAQKLFTRYGLALPHFYHGEEALREQIAAHLVPPEVQELAAKTQREIGGPLERFYGGLQEFDPTLAAALEKSRRKMEYQLQKLMLKVNREAMRRDHRAQQDAAYLYSTVYPHRHLQERFYSFLPFMAQHGPDLLDRMYDSLHSECADHRLVAV